MATWRQLRRSIARAQGTLKYRSHRRRGVRTYTPDDSMIRSVKTGKGNKKTRRANKEARG